MPDDFREAQHSHDHSNHAHAHSIPPGNLNRAFAIGVTLNVLFVVIEAVCGYVGGSMALLADAGHNASDVLGLLVAWGAAYLGRFAPSGRRTYGLRRSSILAALANALILLLATGGIAWEALRRLINPESVAGETMIVVALIGVVVNGGTAALFMAGRQQDLNVRGAFLHMLADAGVSLAVAAGGLIIQYTGWNWADPLLCLMIVAVIVAGTLGLLRDSINLALDAVPEGIDLEAVQAYLRALPGITGLHDLHIWGMSTTETALTVHLVKPDGDIDDPLLARIAEDLHHRFHIMHATIQLERVSTDHGCTLEGKRCRSFK
ncbi:MAG: cation diffusion facilitator family transporter [Planctomycetales bacterium]